MTPYRQRDLETALERAHGRIAELTRENSELRSPVSASRSSVGSLVSLVVGFVVAAALILLATGVGMVVRTSLRLADVGSWDAGFCGSLAAGGVVAGAVIGLVSHATRRRGRWPLG